MDRWDGVVGELAEVVGSILRDVVWVYAFVNATSGNNAVLLHVDHHKRALVFK